MAKEEKKQEKSLEAVIAELTKRVEDLERRLHEYKVLGHQI